MTLLIDHESERNRLESIAADYQNQGYDVKIQETKGNSLIQGA